MGGNSVRTGKEIPHPCWTGTETMLMASILAITGWPWYWGIYFQYIITWKNILYFRYKWATPKWHTMIMSFIQHKLTLTWYLYKILIWCECRKQGNICYMSDDKYANMLFCLWCKSSDVTSKLIQGPTTRLFHSTLCIMKFYVSQPTAQSIAEG